MEMPIYPFKTTLAYIQQLFFLSTSWMVRFGQLMATRFSVVLRARHKNQRKVPEPCHVWLGLENVIVVCCIRHV